MYRHKRWCALYNEPWYMFDTECTCQCTCATDPYNCPQGQALVEAIIKRKKYSGLDAIQELGSDEASFRKLGKQCSDSLPGTHSAK